MQVGEIFLTFRPSGSDECWVDVNLRLFAADTAYSVDTFLRSPISEEWLAYTAQITTNSSGSAGFTPFFIRNSRVVEVRAVTNTGVASAWTVIAC